jgi:hypothetical protein
VEEKPLEIKSHIWEKGDNLSLRSTSRARKRVCLSSKPDYEDRKHFLHAIAAATGCVGIVSSSGSNN